MRDKNFTAKLKLFGDEISSAETSMKSKARFAIRAGREASFWHWDDTGEVLPGFVFDGLKVEISETYTVPELDSDNGFKDGDHYLAILMINREGLNRLLSKFNLKDDHELILESMTCSEKSKFYEKLWENIQEILNDVYFELREKQIRLMNEVNQIHKQKKNIMKYQKKTVCERERL